MASRWPKMALLRAKMVETALLETAKWPKMALLRAKMVEIAVLETAKWPKMTQSGATWASIWQRRSIFEKAIE